MGVIVDKYTDSLENFAAIKIVEQIFFKDVLAFTGYMKNQSKAVITLVLHCP